MAFNWKTFQTRTLTAIIFAAVMLTGLLWNKWSFFALFSIIHFGCWWEYFDLLEKIHKTVYHLATRIGFMIMGFSIMLVFCGPIFQFKNYYLRGDLSFPIAVAGLVLLALGIILTKNIKLKPFGKATLGLLYISLSWGLAMSLYKEISIHVHDSYFVMPSRSNIILMIIISIWINDTMAYITGSMIGKTPLSKISPKKTWEGTIGGIILSVVAVGLITFYGFNSGSATVYIMLLAAIVCVAGTFGDLLESKLKRMAGVKDSGNIMPGHGGFLDRFDSLLLAIPAAWIYVFLVFRF
jgi:phosphatidate cytidylyltransferase